MDKRIYAKIKSYNTTVNAFKLRYRRINEGYALYYELSRKGKRIRKSFNKYVKGKSSSYTSDKRVIEDCITELRDLNQKYEETKSSDFLFEEKRKDYGDANLWVFFEGYYSKNFKNKNTQKPFKNTLHHLRLYKQKKLVKIKEIDMDFCNGFKNYLEKLDLKNSTKNTYLQKLKQVIYFLLENKYITENPIPKKLRFRDSTPDRGFLTAEELTSLMKQPPPPYSDTVSKAFIFSCFTGLRYDDLKELKFSDLSKGVFKIQQGKTKEFVEFKLPPQAKKIVNEMKKQNNNSELVFYRLGSNDRGNNKIKSWARNAGINKNVTWHIGRHTFPCLLLLKKVDIYTVSKYMGHTSIKTTSKYLHMLKEHKNLAAEVLADIGA